MQTVEIEIKERCKESAPLTEFLQESLLVEFACDQLTGFRKNQIQSLIESDPEFKEKYQNVLLSLKYCERLGEIDFSESYLAEISGKNAWWMQALLFIHWRSWPGPLRWAIQGIVVSSITAVLVVNIPWKKVPLVRDFMEPQTIELAKIDRSSDVFDDEEIQFSEEADSEPAENQETGLILQKNDGSNLAQVGRESVKNQRVADLEPKEVADSVEKKIDSQGSLESKNEISELSEKAGDQKTALAGFIYRSYAKFANLEEVAPQISDKIKSLGGAKAGQVKLGWERRGGRYFHFSLPEKNEKEFLDFLKQFGDFSVSKDEHLRVMPEGTLRYILWIEPKREKSQQKDLSGKNQKDL